MIGIFITEGETLTTYTRRKKTAAINQTSQALIPMPLLFSEDEAIVVVMMRLSRSQNDFSSKSPNLQSPN